MKAVLNDPIDPTEDRRARIAEVREAYILDMRESMIPNLRKMKDKIYAQREELSKIDRVPEQAEFFLEQTAIYKSNCVYFAQMFSYFELYATYAKDKDKMVTPEDLKLFEFPRPIPNASREYPPGFPDPDTFKNTMDSMFSSCPPSEGPKPVSEEALPDRRMEISPCPVDGGAESLKEIDRLRSKEKGKKPKKMRRGPANITRKSQKVGKSPGGNKGEDVGEDPLELLETMMS